MNMQSVSLSALEPAAANPRRKIDRKAIEGLAASIRTDGVLHNLVVTPIGGRGKKEKFQIVSGSRRFEALRLLEERGELPVNFTVAVEVRNDLTKDETLRIATVENLQRQNMTPLEEAAALCKLVHKGVTLDDVVAQTGLSASTIKRRLALNGLCKEAKAALSKGEINLAQAEALTLGSDEAQRDILERIQNGSEFSAGDIKDSLLDDRPTVALSIFPVEQYTGTITTDLFAEDETSYFDDAEQFFRLQKDAVAQLVKHHEETAAWVEVTETYQIPEWQFRKARKNQKSGVLINLAPSGRVEVREGLVRPKIEKETAKALAENPVASVKVKAAHSKSLCAYIAHHKTAAVAETLLASPRAAQEVMTVRMVKEFQPHEAFTSLAKEAEHQSTYGVLEAEARIFAGKLGFEIEDGESVWNCFPPYGVSELTLYEAVRGLSDHDLTRLQILITALSFGQEGCERLDTRDSFFNRVARDLKVDMKNHWRPDAAFLSKRNREQLLAVAVECGFAEGASQLSTYKKADLVNGLTRYFHSSKADGGAVDPKARDWLPEAMLFPAVDRDAPADTEVDEEAEDVE
ncbi:MAG: ParB/RepB/Spo0J family partition protein [Alphaproteobacteria bacterium]|nr:ParB/RepB/Spo0J family partition protein [Alphaproteobacteria bacterium]